jgi:hypothetical protein
VIVPAIPFPKNKAVAFRATACVDERSSASISN